MPVEPATPEIPTLDISMQATEIVDPVTRWGRIARGTHTEGTYHFYTCDYKFSALWSNPDRLVASGCKVVVEPNYSSWPEMPVADFLAGIHRKRTLARYWQSKGVRIIVDLNTDPKFRPVSLLGVPDGWRSYAVRKQGGRGLDDFEADYRMACRHAGTEDIFFVVFGGWRKVRDLCAERGWVWVSEDMHRVRGSTNGERKWG